VSIVVGVSKILKYRFIKHPFKLKKDLHIQLNSLSLHENKYRTVKIVMLILEKEK